MISKLPASRIKFVAQVGILAVGLWASSSAWCYDTVQPPQTKTQKALSKLHDITDRGLDCSGLVRYVFKAAWGTDLPRTAAEISRVGEKVDKFNLQPGDLLFYNTMRRGFSHVGIYLGDSKFIHSPSTGGQVRIESMDISYWKQRFNGARRINDPDQQQTDLRSADASRLDPARLDAVMRSYNLQ
jgi:cell wall-associated NlpC family hydrolase